MGSFKTIKDIQKNIINRSYQYKKNIDPLLYSKFYKKLSLVFWSCNRYLLHSYAVFESYKRLKIYISNKLSKKQKDLKTEQTQKLHTMLNEALISILIVPSSSINDQSKGSNNNNSSSSNNKDYTHSLFQLFNDFFGFGRKQAMPSKAALLNSIIKEINSYNLTVSASSNNENVKNNEKKQTSEDDEGMLDIFANAKNLYQLIVIKAFSPLTFTLSLNDIMNKLETESNANISFYLCKIYQMGVIVLLKQLALCYKSISWKRFKQLTFSDIELERIIAFSVYYGNVCCRISHSNKLITFSDNNLESKMFCDSIVELNAMLIRIKDEHQSIDKNHHNIQRQNVFNQIRNQISLEHDKIQNRLKQIRRTRTNQIKI